MTTTDARGEVTATAVLSRGSREGTQRGERRQPAQEPDEATAADVAPSASRTGHAPIRGKDGYYELPDGTRLMSVTNIISGGVPKEGLVHWAAIEVARCTIQHLPRLSRIRGEAAREDAYQWLRRAAERKRDQAGDLGTAIHDQVEHRILGAPTPELTDEQAPFITAFDQFLSDQQPEFEATEMVVANPADLWAGKLDSILRLPRLGADLVLVDWKTGKKVYDEAALQLAAYRRATVGWLRDGTEVVPPPSESAVVVHLRPDLHAKHGGYRIYRIDTSDDVYRSFLAARDVALTWTRRKDKRAVTVMPVAKLKASK